jgi:hypothetical protein
MVPAMQQPRRESQTVNAVQHEALLSLARAIARAEDYIYVEGPVFSATSFGNDGGLDRCQADGGRITDCGRR